MAYRPYELLTLADQLRLLAQSLPEDVAKARLTRLFRLSGGSIYSPKYAVAYDDAVIDFATGRVTLRRLPRQPFTPTVTAAAHYELFPSAVSATPEAKPLGPAPASRPPNQRGPEPGSTGFKAADDALCPIIDRMRETGEARSAIAAARVLAEHDKVAGAGTPESRATRLAKHYGKWRSGARSPD